MSAPRGLRKGRTSESVKAGLIFPVSRLKRHVKKKTRLRVSQTFPVYFAGVLEYLCAEILELGGNAAKHHNRKRITPRHIFLAVAHDEELHKMLKTVIIPGGGVKPNIPVELLQKTKQKKMPPAAGKYDLTSPYLFESPPRSRKALKEGLLWRPNPKKAKLKSLPPNPSPPQSPEHFEVEDEESSHENQSDIPGVDVLLQKQLPNGPKIIFVKGDFQNLSVDVIVSPTDADFSMEGKIGQILEAAGGKEFSQSIEELKLENGPLGRLDAVMSAAINAFAKYVIHCRGPESLDESASVKLEELVEKCLNLADSRYFKSIAFPIVGLSGLSERLSAEILLNTVVNYFLSVMCTSLTQLYFIVHDSEVVNRILEEIKHI